MNGAADPGLTGALDAVLDAAVDAIIIIDEGGVIQRFNRAASAMFGYTEDELLGDNVNRLMPEPHRSQHHNYLARYHETGIAAVIGKGREEMGQRSDGTVFPMHLSVGEIRHGGRHGYVGFIRDLSEVRESEEQLRQLEEQLLHADRLVILGELTAGIAHEINQPLTAIAAYADAGCKLIEQLDEAEASNLRSVCERIGGQARRAGEVVQRLRGLVRTGKVSKARHDLNQIIEHILLLFEFELKRSGTELIFHSAEALDPMYVDEIQIQQILVNLVKNGLDAITEAGRVDGRVEIHVEQQGLEVKIAVEDNGPGVPEALRPKLFESFFTTKPKGVGLGLSICRNIAAAHGGTLHYEQPAGGGSRFVLTLPLRFIG
jgi:two-component system sensor kinase FixL